MVIWVGAGIGGDGESSYGVGCGREVYTTEDTRIDTRAGRCWFSTANGSVVRLLGGESSVLGTGAAQHLFCLVPER